MKSNQLRKLSRTRSNGPAVESQPKRSLQKSRMCEEERFPCNLYEPINGERIIWCMINVPNEDGCLSYLYVLEEGQFVQLDPKLTLTNCTSVGFIPKTYFSLSDFSET